MTSGHSTTAESIDLADSIPPRRSFLRDLRITGLRDTRAEFRERSLGAQEMKNAMKYLWAFLLPLLRAEDDPKQYPVTKANSCARTLCDRAARLSGLVTHGSHVKVKQHLRMYGYVYACKV